MRYIKLFLLLLLPIALQANPVSNLLERLEKGASKHFILEKVSSEKDFFELESREGRVVVRSNTYVNMASGVRWYLKYYAHVNLSWNQMEVSLPAVLPVVPKKERHETDMSLRYDLNYCTHSYSMAFWDWQRWEKEIDWMALHGINLPLAITGTECVWYNVLKKLGYSVDEINQFVSGPAFFAWWLMNNLEGWGGPNPENWYAQRLILQKKIVKRMRELDIEPVFAGYSGMVPNNAHEKLGLQVTDPGMWCGYRRPAFLQPTDPKFGQIAKLYYQELTKLFGKANYYSMDPFHEGGNVAGVNLKEAGKAIMTEMKRCNPQSTWVAQAWGENPREAMIKGLNKGDLLVLDLYSESRPQWGDPASTWYRKEGFNGHNWIYCMLLNFGGNVGLHGKMQHVIDEYFKARSTEFGKTLKGVGITMEGIENNPVMYELLCELPWHDSHFSKEEWLKDYVTSRYGRFHPSIYNAWIALSNSIYNCPVPSTQQGTHESVFCARPSDKVFQVSSFSEMSDYYHPVEVIDAARTFASVADEFRGNNNYEYDLVDIVRQAVAEKGRMAYQRMVLAKQARNKALFEDCSKHFMDLLLMQDRLLATRPEFCLGTWINQAKSLGSTPEESQLYVWNAKVQITTWGNRKAANEGGLRDYAHREWSGLLKDFYAMRWQVYIKAALKNWDVAEQPAIDYYTLEEAWVNKPSSYDNVPQESAVDVTQEILAAWQQKSDQAGINIIPAPVSLKVEKGRFKLTSGTSIYASSSEARKVAHFFASKLNVSTGFALSTSAEEREAGISLLIDSGLDMNEEGYQLRVTPQKVEVRAKTAKGLFYGMQTFMQLLPAEVESPVMIKKMIWEAPCVVVDDAPRFGYRGFLLDACRHFIPVASVKKQLDVLSLFKINTMHWHLTEDQGWRIEIKKYPKLTEVGAKRMEGEGIEHGGFYTQEQIKEIVAYAAERFITIIPELELPGHELAAIAAYPELSCQEKQVKPRIIWGVEDVVMCPGKETMFTFLEDVIAEMVPLFPGTYFHIGGDECPKTRWKSCPACQARIKSEGFRADAHHTAEEYLQSYVVRRMEKVLKGYGKRIIGWDEILEGGLSPEATVMSWRGEIGGIEAAAQNHDVIMASHGNGMYLDQYQGDSKIEPVAIGGYTSLERTYSYNPVPDTLVTMGKGHYVKGVQCNNWAEYMYTPEIMEYRMYPRVLALAEIAWTPVERKNYKDFEHRIHSAYVRLDGHDIHYHIPQPEQPGGSCNFIAFIDSTMLQFATSRPEKMVYSLDGTEPTPESAEYMAPISVSKNTTLKIRTLLPSGKMSATRTIIVEKQTLAPACMVQPKSPGLKVQMFDGMYLKSSQLKGVAKRRELTVKALHEISGLNGGEIYKSGGVPHAAIATGYVEIPEDGVYFFSSNNEEVWVDGKLLITNEGEVKLFSRQDTSIALAKGLHELKIVFLGHIIGGWPSWWDNADVAVRRANWKEFKSISPEQLFH